MSEWKPIDVPPSVALGEAELDAEPEAEVVGVADVPGVADAGGVAVWTGTGEVAAGAVEAEVVGEVEPHAATAATIRTDASATEKRRTVTGLCEMPTRSPG